MAPVGTVLLLLFSSSLAARNGDSQHTELSSMSDETEVMATQKPKKLTWNVTSMVFFGILVNCELASDDSQFKKDCNNADRCKNYSVI